MAAPKLWDATIKPNAPASWWIEWRQARTDSSGGTTKVADYGRQIWRARMSFSRRNQQVEINRIWAFVLGLQGWVEPFRVGVAYDNEVRLGAGTVTAVSGGIVGRTLQTQGWTIGGSTANGTVMKAGQFFDMTVVAQEPRLQMLTADAVASGGIATLQFTPGIQVPTGSGEVLHYRFADHASSPARATMMLANPDALVLQLTSPVVGSVDVELEEWWPDRPQ